MERLRQEAQEEADNVVTSAKGHGQVTLEDGSGTSKWCCNSNKLLCGAETLASQVNDSYPQNPPNICIYEGLFFDFKSDAFKYSLLNKSHFNIP